MSEDKLFAYERELMERICSTTEPLTYPVGNLVNIIDRLAPRPEQVDPVERVLRAMRHPQALPHLEYWAGEIAKALKEQSR